MRDVITTSVKAGTGVTRRPDKINGFTVNHYAQCVPYCCDDMLEKNKVWVIFQKLLFFSNDIMFFSNDIMLFSNDIMLYFAIVVYLQRTTFLATSGRFCAKVATILYRR